jgi:hypothetical protein
MELERDRWSLILYNCYCWSNLEWLLIVGRPRLSFTYMALISAKGTEAPRIFVGKGLQNGRIPDRVGNFSYRYERDFSWNVCS